MSRLKIAKGRQALELKPNTSLQLDLQSPIYFGDRSPEVIPSVKTYTISVANTPNNRSMLGRPDQLDNPEPFLTEPGWFVFYDGRLILSGRLKVENAANEGDINVTFIGGLAGGLSDLKDLYLTDIDFGGEQEIGSALGHANDVINNPGNYKYTFPSIKLAASVETDEDGNPIQYKYLNLYRKLGFRQEFINPDTSETYYSTLAPMPYAKFVLDKALEQVGYSLRGVFDTHPLKAELINLLVFHNGTLDSLKAEVAQGEVQRDNVELSTSLNLNRHVPRIKANEYIRRLCNTFAWAPFIDNNDQTLTLKDYNSLIDESAKIDWTSKVDPRYSRENVLDDVVQVFKYEHTDSDDYGTENAKLLNNRSVDLYFQNLDEAVANLSDDDKGKIVYIESVNEYFEMVIMRTPTIPILKSLGRDLGCINEGSEPTFALVADTLFMITKSDFLKPYTFRSFSADEYLPAFYGQVVSPWNEGEPIDDLVFLIYRGIQDDFTDSYPLASNSRYDFEEEQIGDMSLLWHVTGGLYETWWQRWHDLIQRIRPVTYPTRLTSADLETLDFSKKVIIDQQVYFIRRIRITLEPNQIRTASVEYMQIV